MKQVTKLITHVLYLSICIMSTTSTMKCMDLILHKKPATVSTYNWCINLASKNAEKKLEKWLTLAGKNKKHLQKKRDEIFYEYREEYNEEKAKNLFKSHTPFRPKIKKIIVRTLENETLRKRIGYKGYEDRGNEIIIKTNFITKHGYHWDHIVIINAKTAHHSAGTLYNLILIKQDNIPFFNEFVIAHEIAHIMLDHTLTPKEYNVKDAFMKAAEIEADIVSVFNSTYLAKKARDYFNYCMNRYGQWGGGGINHPYDFERYNYFTTMTQAMEQEHTNAIHAIFPEIEHTLNLVETQFPLWNVPFPFSTDIFNWNCQSARLDIFPKNIYAVT